MEHTEEKLIAKDLPSAEAHPAKEEAGAPELPNVITILSKTSLGEKPVVKYLHHWENAFFSFVLIIIVSVIVIKATRRKKLIPTGLQNLVEYIVEVFDDFVCGILGKQNGRRFLPYLGSLFLFIFFNNIMGLIPFLKSPTSSIRVTVALAICTFFYVQYVGLKDLGVLGYLHHVAGSPKGIVGWAMVPMMLPMHIIEELAKPLSLALRLFGNILGEDVLLAVLTGLGIAFLGWVIGMPHIPVGFPFQLFAMFLAIIFSFVQALVFTLLSLAYFIMVLPHEE